MNELADTFRPILARLVAHTAPPTQAALRPSIEQALSGIEAMCRIAAMMTPAGPRAAQGPKPEFAAQKLLFLAATPEEHTIFGHPTWTWPKPLPALDGVTPSRLWATMAQGVRQANPEAVFNCFNARCAPEEPVRLRTRATQLRRKGCVPLLLLLCAASETQACGLGTVIPLPAPIDVQLAGKWPPRRRGRSAPPVGAAKE